MRAGGSWAMRKWLLSGSLFLAGLLPSAVFAQLSVDDIGLHETAEGAYGTGQRNLDIGTFIGTYVIQPLLGLSGIIFLVLIIYGGILWMTDQGNLESVGKAKKLLVHATIGLIIIMSAFAITNLILSSVAQTAVSTG